MQNKRMVERISKLQFIYKGNSGATNSNTHIMIDSVLSLSRPAQTNREVAKCRRSDRTTDWAAHGQSGDHGDKIPRKEGRFNRGRNRHPAWHWTGGEVYAAVHISLREVALIQPLRMPLNARASFTQPLREKYALQNTALRC